MTYNSAMFRRIYDQITQYPETHEQADWEIKGSCGTTRCIAGWALAFAYNTDDIWPWVRKVNIVTEAAHILGLNEEEAYNLFLHTDGAEAVEKCLYYANKGE